VSEGKKRRVHTAEFKGKVDAVRAVKTVTGRDDAHRIRRRDA
jgi:hypothetical protein